MLSFIIRRLGASILVLLVASFLIYNLASLAGDPLGDLRGSTAPNKAALIAARIDQLQLNVPTPLRFFIWLGGILKVFIGQFTLGDSVNGHSVIGLVGSSAANTLQLVTAATLLAVIFGVAIGMSTAIRQYSGYDYTVTFLSFLFFSLPAFWVAVLLKLYVAIGFNNFLGSPVISPLSIAVISLVSGFIWMSIIGGEGKPRLIVFGSATVITAATLGFLVVTDWFTTPQLGPVLIAVLGALTALMVTSLTTGLSNRRALYAALITVGIGVALWYPLQFLFAAFPAFWMLELLGVLSIAVGLAVGYFMGRDDRWPAARTAAIMSFLVGLLVFADRLMRSWPDYVSAVGGRPIATVGANTPDLEGSIWLHVIDSYTHLLLPTMSLILISLAGYTRYARASLLEVMNQDYVRTARAKGLTERTVVMRHAFRNAMIPIITVVAFDVGGLIGGAVITETIFAWRGMGSLFTTALRDPLDLNVLMAVFLVVGTFAIVFNILADLAYTALDPRIRVS
ncbi:ABC transporter permease [Lacisediminihabitans sp.]|uniref:ABC transporter permease n=1 Tax=Lacisediminihabitans sp. TaxID=2787631 RepID=UPI002F92EF77